MGIALRLGAHEVVVSTDAAQMAAQAGSFDLILDAVSASHDINAYDPIGRFVYVQAKYKF